MKNIKHLEAAVNIFTPNGTMFTEITQGLPIYFRHKHGNNDELPSSDPRAVL